MMVSMNKPFETWLEKHITLRPIVSPREEMANAWTHLGGAALSLVGMIVLIRSGWGGDGRTLAGFAVFSGAMLLLFASSGFYHLAPPSPVKRVLRILDHSNIYFLIAGTYTPLFIAMNTGESRFLLLLIWAIALAGVLFTLLFWGRYGFLHVLFYLAMGWMAVFVRDQLIAAIPAKMLFWILAGGITYSAGVLFYALKKIPYGHAVWHLFVLAGAGLFYFGILRELPRL